MKVLFVLIIMGVAMYALVRVVQRRGVTPPPKGPLAGARRSRRPEGPLGPDDDDDFLRDLDRKRLGGGDSPDS